MGEKGLTDEEMIARIQQGERRYLEILVKKYYDDVYYYCCYRTGDSQNAYDCAQETFLKLTRYIHTYGEKKKFKGYLFSIARNVCVDYFRSCPREAVWTEEILQVKSAPGRDEIKAMENSQLIRHAIGLLNEEQREAVVLRFYHDFKVREIAGIVGVPLPTAKSRLKRGIARLKEILEREGVTYEG